MSRNPNNPGDVTESPIRSTLIPSCLELPDDIDDSNDNENEEDDDDKDDDLSLVPVESEEATIHVDFKHFNFLVHHHENSEPTKRNTTKYILFVFV